MSECAQEATRGAQAGDSTTVIVRAATLIDGTGAVRRNTDVVVRNGRIVELRPSRGRATVDLGNRVLVPGLIDTHVHLGWYITTKGRLHQREDGDDESVAAINAVGNAQRMLQAGFTTIRDVGNSAEWAMSDVRRAVEAG